MSLDAYLRLCAARAGRAQARARLRHVYLAPRPLVVTGYHFAGDPGAVLALRYGTTPEDVRTRVVGEPRDRDERAACLAAFGADLCAYLDGFRAREEAPADAPEPTPATEDGGTVPELALCRAAPQVLFPDPGTAAWVTDTLGRSMPDPDARAHLAFLASQRVLPGAAVVVTATELLATHWCTGQLPPEDARLGALLAWVDPPAGTDAATAAVAAEERPPAGPESDPQWDRDVLRPLVGQYRRARIRSGAETVRAELADECGRALDPGWCDTWAAWQHLTRLPEATHATQRRDDDRRAWTRHLDRLAAGGAPRRFRLDRLQSFRFLHELERRTAAVARDMAQEDPLVLAGHVAAGDALAGEVVARDCDRRQPPPPGKQREVLRPQLCVAPAVRFDRPVGTPLRWVGNTAVHVEVAAVGDDGTVELTVVRGACQSPAAAARTLPEPGAQVAMLSMDDTWYPSQLPDELPWTHAPAEQPAAEETAAGDEPAEPAEPAEAAW